MIKKTLSIVFMLLMLTCSAFAAEDNYYRPLSPNLFLKYFEGYWNCEYMPQMTINGTHINQTAVTGVRIHGNVDRGEAEITPPFRFTNGHKAFDVTYVEWTSPKVFRVYLSGSPRTKGGFYQLIKSPTAINSNRASFPPALQDDWYNEDNSRIMRIREHSLTWLSLKSINYIAGSPSRGHAKALLEKAGGEIATYDMIWDSTGNIKTLTLNGNNWHTRPKVINSESVGGVRLGMSMADVQRIYGAAPVVKNIYNSVVWYYPQDNWAISFQAGIVKRIAIPQGSTKLFDNSGFNAYTPANTYKARYNDSSRSTERVILSNGEFIWLDCNPDIFVNVWGHVFNGSFVELNAFGA